MKALRALCALIVLSVTAVPASVIAQDAPALSRGTGVVIGAVVSGDTGQPVPSATIEILSSADSTVIGRSATDEEGRIRLANVAAGTYVLRIRSLGYGVVHTQAFEIADAEVRNLGTLRLPISALALDPIEVSTERNAVTFEADRTSYAVGVMPGTQGTTVTETLQQIPDLEVDIDGNIRLRGNAPMIYINGRPSPMEGEALTMFLEQFPADYLSKIEVMDNPSARYGSRGSGGIVNLVLKEDVELGLSGSAFATAGTRGQYSAGVRGTAQRGEWTYSGGGFLRLSDTDRSSFDLRQNLVADPAFLQQDARTEQSGLAGNADMDIRYEPNERTQFSLEARVSRSGNETDGFSTTTHLDTDESTILEFGRTSAAASRHLSASAGFGFEYAWEPRRHELEAEVRVNTGRQRGDRLEQITDGLNLDPDGFLIPAELTREDEQGTDRGVTLNLDYSRALGERMRMELGVEAETGSNHDDRMYYETDADGDVVVTDRGIVQDERTAALYGTLQRDFGSLGIQAGLRGEHLVRDFSVPGADVERSYTNVFPSFNVSYRFDSSRQLRLSYSRRIGLPGISVLNPVDRSTDPLYRRIGNPDIEPRFTHSVTLNASWSGSSGTVRLSPYWQKTVKNWEQITTVDANGVSTRTYENLASETGYGATLNYSLRNRGPLGGNVSITGRRQVRDASNLSERYSGSSLRWSSRANLHARVNDAFSLDGSFSYQPPVDLPQGRSDASYTGDFGFRYRFADNRASLRLSLRDPFGLREQSSRFQDETWIQIGQSRESTRAAEINFSYSLGGGGWRRGGGLPGRR